MALGETAKLIVELNLDDRLSGKMGRVNSSLSTLGRGLAQTGRGVGQVAAGIGRIGAIAATAAAGGLTAVVATAVSFEDAFAGVEKTVDATEAELTQLMETFRAMAREIPVSFESLSALGETAGALGIAVDDIDEFVKVAATLGVTTDVSAEQAATSLGVLSNILRLTGEDYERFADVLVRLGNEGASTESSILAIAERAGAGAALIGIAADETLAWSAAVANLGIEVEAGGTALQKFFVESLRNLQDDDTLLVMAETAGVTGKAFKQAFEKDASKALQTFVVGLGKLSNAERLAVLEALGFSDIRITRALLGLAGNVEATEKAFTELGNAAGAASKEAERRFATTASQIQKLKNNLRDVGFVIGSELLPVTNELINDLVGELNKPGTQRSIRAFGQDLAKGIRDFVTELRGADFSPFISALKIIGEVGGKVVDIFLKLPPSVQAALVTGLALNKLSGGLLASGVGNIAGGVIKIAFERFAARGSSFVNPLYVAVTNQIPGQGPGPGGFFGSFGGKGGWFGGLLAGASKIFAGLFVANLASELITNKSLFDNLISPITPSKQPLGPLRGGKPVPVEVVNGTGKSKLYGNVLDTRALIADLKLSRMLKLPNNVTSSLTTTARGVSQLPPILSRVERASIATSQKIQDAKFATLQGLSSVRGAVDRIKVSPRVNVNATIINNVQVNANRVVSQITRARVATGTIPEFA